MKVAITGHTHGIGKEIYNYFLKNNYEVKGFSRSTGYDISSSTKRKKILENIKDFDIFVANFHL
jgi:nucleoside-diphosphate-sugar epimerase